jgi:hypothetical protein
LQVNIGPSDDDEYPVTQGLHRYVDEIFTTSYQYLKNLISKREDTDSSHRHQIMLVVMVCWRDLHIHMINIPTQHDSEDSMLCYTPIMMTLSSMIPLELDEVLYDLCVENIQLFCMLQ